MYGKRKYDFNEKTSPPLKKQKIENDNSFNDIILYKLVNNEQYDLAKYYENMKEKPSWYSLNSYKHIVKHLQNEIEKNRIEIINSLNLSLKHTNILKNILKDSNNLQRRKLIYLCDTNKPKHQFISLFDIYKKNNIINSLDIKRLFQTLYNISCKDIIYISNNYYSPNINTLHSELQNILHTSYNTLQHILDIKLYNDNSLYNILIKQDIVTNDNLQNIISNYLQDNISNFGIYADIYKHTQHDSIYFSHTEANFNTCNTLPDISCISKNIILNVIYNNNINTQNDLNYEDYKGINHIINRIYKMTSRLSFLENIIGICISNIRASIIISEICDKDIYQRKYSIYFLDLKYIPSLLQQLYNKPDNFYFTKEKQYLDYIPKIFNINLPISFFKVKFIKSSSDGIIYKILPPKICNNNSIIISNSLNDSIIIKIVSDSNQYKNEIQSLNILKEYSNDLDNPNDFYIYGYTNIMNRNKFEWFLQRDNDITSNNHRLQSFISNISYTNTVIKATSNSWWNIDYNTYTFPKTGGILLMREGKQIIKELSISKKESSYIFAVLQRQLRILHKQGRVHRDIQPSNILLFPNNINSTTNNNCNSINLSNHSIQLIDYGYSGNINNKFKVPYGIAAKSGYTILEQLKQSDIVYWKEYDDIEMLNLCIIDMINN